MGRVARLSTFSLPVPELWVPRPCVFCNGGYEYHEICHAHRAASHLRRSSPALYHLLVLPAIASFERARNDHAC